MYCRGDRITCVFGTDDQCTGTVISNDITQRGIWFIRDVDQHAWMSVTAHHMITVRFVDWNAISLHVTCGLRKDK